MDMEKKRLIGFSVVIFSVILFLLLAYYLRSIFAPFFIAYILQLVLRPPVNMLESRGISHSKSVIIVFAGTFLVIALILMIIIPAFISELSNIQNNIDEYSRVITSKFEEIRDTVYNNSGTISKLISENPNFIEEIKAYFKDTMMQMVQRITQNLFNIICLSF